MPFLQSACHVGSLVNYVLHFVCYFLCLYVNSWADAFSSPRNICVKPDVEHVDAIIMTIMISMLVILVPGMIYDFMWGEKRKPSPPQELSALERACRNFNSLSCAFSRCRCR